MKEKDQYDKLLEELLKEAEELKNNTALSDTINRGLENDDEPINHEKWLEGFLAFLSDNDEIFKPLNQYEICKK